MKLRQLQFAKMVAETKSFSRAAEICHATQPTLSNSISQLEEELGGKLFQRSTRKVELTAFGAEMMPKITAILDAEQELKRAASAFHNPDEKLLRIGLSPLVDMAQLEAVLQPYRRRYPNHGIFFKECLLDDLSQRLADDVIDLAIIPQDMVMEGYEHFAFYSDPLFYIPSVPRNIIANPGYDHAMTITDLPADPIIMTGGGCGLNGSLERLFAAQGVSLTPYRGQAASYQAIEEWTDLAIGAAILPQAKLHLSKQRALPLMLNDGRKAHFTFSWIWPNLAKERPHIADFVDYVRTTVPALMQSETSVKPLTA